MDSDFARQYYESASADHWWFQGRKALVAGLLERFGVGSGSFLDLGAGTESLFPHYLPVVKLDVVRPEGVKGPFVQASAESLPFRDHTFEGVGLFDVLEHLAKPSRSLKEVARVVRPRGLILLTVPAYQWLWSPHDDVVRHERRYTVRSLRDELMAAHLRVEWISGFYRFLLGAGVMRAAFSLAPEMKLPPPALNRALTRLSRRSVQRTLHRPGHLGLSIVAVVSN